MTKSTIILLLISFIFAACGTNEKTIQYLEGETDHTSANIDAVHCKHLKLDAQVDFDTKTIYGNAEWTFNNFSDAKEIIFDIQDLKINKVLVSGKEVEFEIIDASFELKDNEDQALKIPIIKGDSVLSISYNTGQKARALQWLDPSQTAGKKMPYLFTQCEAINARSLVPCQDAPAVRVTYSASLQVPKGMMAVMSAKNPQEKSDDGRYNFEMELSVPTYLIALAVGDIEYKAIDERSGVYTEPSMLAKCAKELEDIPEMMTAAEKFGGPYGWGNYDVLVCPPSFPIGGMENPRLTFATPTIIAGDKSLVSLIAHELAHSWSGNFVTNSNWNDLWLNEGFTTYFERRIMEEISDPEYTNMLWEIGHQDLMEDLESDEMNKEDQRLKVDLKGRDPEAAFSNIPYEKGAFFLRTMESAVGRDSFDEWLRSYFKTHAFTPMNTKMAIDFIQKNLQLDPKKVDINEWIFKAGIPENYTYSYPAQFKKIDAASKEFMAGKNAEFLNARSWSTHEWLHFLRKLPKPLAVDRIKSLDASYSLTGIGNYEIANEWYKICIASNYEKANNQIESFLTEVGRGKFLEPLYRELLKSDEGKRRAQQIYKKVKDGYHPRTQKKIGDIINS